MSWQADLLANMDGKQTKDSFNHRIVSTLSCTQGPAKSETLGDPQTQPRQTANHNLIWHTIKYERSKDHTE